MISSTVRARLGLCTSVLALLAVTAPVVAQTQTAAAEQPPEPAPTDAPDDSIASEEEVVVTGSRIARPEFEFPNPIQAYTAETLQQSGETNVTDFLVNSPALLSSTTNVDVAGSNLDDAQLVGVNLLNLRNLGTNRTLVLVNGRRHVAAYQGTAAVDINTLPVELIERVDVLTGGTSAVYGADGVSGVVNFILKRDFEGIAARAQAGISQRGDAGNRFISITAGQNFAEGRGNFAASYEYNVADRFSQRDRLNYGRTGPTFALTRNPDDPSSDDDPNVPDNILLTDLKWADSAVNGAVDVDFDFGSDYDGDGNIYDVGDYVPGTAFTRGGSSTPRESYFGDYTPFSERHVFNAIGSFEVSDALRLFGEAKFVESNALTFAQPTYDFYTLLFPDNAYLQQRLPGLAPDGAQVTRDHFDFGIRNFETERETYRGVIGAEGRISENARYELSYTYGESNTVSTTRNDRISDRYYAAIDAVVNPSTGQITCRINLPGETQIQSFTYNNIKYGTFDEDSGLFLGAPRTFARGQCVPLNLLGTNAPSQAALDFVTVDHSARAKISQHVVSGSISGDFGSLFSLPGGDVGFALGAEYRDEHSRFVPSAVEINADLLDGSPSAISDGGFDVKEAFAELNVPLLRDLPFAETLSFGAAFRISDYSTVGQTETWSVNGVYAPVRDVSFRGTYSEAVRAPNLTEFFGPRIGTFEFIGDPCGPELLAEGTEFRAANCTAALTALGFDATEQAAFDPANDATSPANSSILGFTSGNQDLTEETARTWTAGVVLRPRFIPGLTISADWYDIRLRDAIATATAQDVVDLCYDQPTLDNVYCEAIGRSSLTGYVSTYIVQPENVAAFETAGLDVNLNYRFAPFSDGGVFNLKVAGNYLDKLTYVPTLGADVDNDREEPLAPEYSATGDLTWSKDGLTINYGINWFSGTRRYTTEQTDANPDIAEPRYLWYSERWEHELQLSLDVTEGFNFYGGVENLLDTKPDDGASAYPISAIGRYFYFGARARF